MIGSKWMICRKKQNLSFCLKNMFVNFLLGRLGQWVWTFLGGGPTRCAWRLLRCKRWDSLKWQVDKLGGYKVYSAADTFGLNTYIIYLVERYILGSGVDVVSDHDVIDHVGALLVTWWQRNLPRLGSFLVCVWGIELQVQWYVPRATEWLRRHGLKNQSVWPWYQWWKNTCTLCRDTNHEMV